MNRFITGVDEYISSGFLPIYYSIVLILGLVVFLKHYKLKYSVYFVLVFWQGLFIYIGEVFLPIVQDVFNIILFLLTLILFGKSIFKNNTKRIKAIRLSFILLTISYIITWIITKDTFITNLSTFARDYFSPFLLLVALVSDIYVQKNVDKYVIFLKNIIIVQIILSVIKVVILGFGESIVGSITFTGGGLATIIPIISILLFWNYKPHAKQNWRFLFSLLIIAVASNKRAPVFIIPIMIVLLIVYVNKTRTLMSFVKYVPLFMILLFLGIKTNPSLNPERSRWGSFDPVYAANYAIKYIYGDPYRMNHDLYYGRGGGSKLIFSEYYKIFPTRTLIFGHGLTETLKNYSDFEANKFLMASKATINGALDKLISFGYIGLILFIIYGYIIINLIPLKRLKILTLFLFIFDMFFYDGQVLGHNAAAILFILFIIYTRQKFSDIKI